MWSSDYLQIPKVSLWDAEPGDGLVAGRRGCKVEFTVIERHDIEAGEERTDVVFGGEIVRDSAFAVVGEEAGEHAWTEIGVWSDEFALAVHAIFARGQSDEPYATRAEYGVKRLGDAAQLCGVAVIDAVESDNGVEGLIRKRDVCHVGAL